MTDNSAKNESSEVAFHISSDYKLWLGELKRKVRAAQVKAALAASRELILFYWELGASISRKLATTDWGAKVVDQLAKDLSSEFPDTQGFSRTNLYYMKKFYELFATFPEHLQIIPPTGGQIEIAIMHPDGTQTAPPVIHQLGGQLPWSHIKVILDKLSAPEEIKFYICATIENGWSRDVLTLQIKSDLYTRQGKATTNFSNTLPNPQSDLAQQTIKDPYCFDFLTMTNPYNERDIEDQLTTHITKFLLELGKGFAFVGRQYHLEVDGNDYYMDLLFYHIKLRCYVVVELKNTRFMPEYAGKLNFYLSAVDSFLKSEDDNPTIGILLCRDKRNIETEFALRGMSQPMGVSEFTLTETLPDELKGALPTVAEIESDISNLDHRN